MLFSTPTQFAVLALVLIAGWLLGLASHPGGRKWKDRYLAERDAHAAARRDADTRAAAADQRAAELERDHARLATAAPVTTATVAPREAVAVPVAVAPAPTTSFTVRPAHPVGERDGAPSAGRPLDR